MYSVEYNVCVQCTVQCLCTVCSTMFVCMAGVDAGEEPGGEEA